MKKNENSESIVVHPLRVMVSQGVATHFLPKPPTAGRLYVTNL